MAKAARTIHHPLLFVFVLISLLATLGAASGVGAGGRRCPPVPSMTAEGACTAVSGTRHMRGLCLRTLRAGAGAAAPVTRHAAAAVRAALGS